MIRKSVVSLVMAGSAAWGTLSFAQEADLFSRLDADSDGMVTAEEAGAEKKAIFERMLRNADKNEDGKLSKEEFAAGLKDAAPQAAPPGGFGDNPAGRLGSFSPEEIMKRMDKNGDGKIQKDEAPERMRENFDRLDANADGAVDAKEFGRVVEMMQGRSPAGQPRPEGTPGERPTGDRMGFPPLARIFDADGNGELSKEEIANASAALQKLDKNDDGKVSGDELMTVVSDGPRPDGSRPEAGRPDRPAIGNFNPREIMDRLKQADADKDGKLSKEEAPERMRERFDMVDSNSDGFIDEVEVRQMVEKLREQFGAGGRPKPE